MSWLININGIAMNQRTLDKAKKKNKDEAAENRQKEGIQSCLLKEMRLQPRLRLNCLEKPSYLPDTELDTAHSFFRWIIVLRPVSVVLKPSGRNSVATARAEHSAKVESSHQWRILEARPDSCSSHRNARPIGGVIAR